MSEKQKKALSDGLISIGNIVAGSMVFGQFITNKDIQLSTFLLGILIGVIFYLAGLAALKEKR